MRAVVYDGRGQQHVADRALVVVVPVVIRITMGCMLVLLRGIARKKLHELFGNAGRAEFEQQTASGGRRHVAGRNNCT